MSNWLLQKAEKDRIKDLEGAEKYYNEKMKNEKYFCEEEIKGMSLIIILDDNRKILDFFYAFSGSDYRSECIKGLKKIEITEQIKINTVKVNMYSFFRINKASRDMFIEFLKHKKKNEEYFKKYEKRIRLLAMVHKVKLSDYI